MTAGAPSPAAQNIEEEPAVRENVMHSIPELRTISFAYDSAALSAATRETLRQNAVWLKDHADVTVQVAGHCDQRGTEEYNLALGQRRAAEVRRYYMMMGVAGSRIATISYGKDKPLCEGQAESCWRRNRRAETLAAAPTVAGNPRGQ